MAKQPLISIPFLLIIIINLGLNLWLSKAIAAQSPAQAPSSPAAEAPDEPKHHAAPPNVTDILEKAGGFTTFIRLLKNTGVSNQMESQLNDTNNDLTILAPTNEAFSALKPGTLNDLSNEDKIQLLQFHLIPSFLSIPNFQTVSNPLRTQAPNTRDYPLNVAASPSSVNISTGLVNTTLSGTVYSDNHLAIYRLQKVLLPLAIFGSPISPSPSPAPSPSPLKAPSPSKPRLSSPSSVDKPKKQLPPPAAAPSNSSSTSTTPASVNLAPVTSVDLSGGVGVAAANGVASSVGLAVVAGVYLWSRLL